MDPYDKVPDGGYLIPASIAAEIIKPFLDDKPCRLRRASRGWRKRSRLLKQRGEWKGGPISTYIDRQLPVFVGHRNFQQ